MTYNKLPSFPTESQGSVLTSLLLNIFINGILFLLNNSQICNYTDDKTIYFSHQKLQELAIKLENTTAKLSKPFAGNFMKLNRDKCHLLVCGLQDTRVSIKIDLSVIKEKKEEKIIGDDN